MRGSPNKEKTRVTYLRASILGLASALALVPATSRSQTAATTQIILPSAVTTIPSDSKMPDTDRVQLLRLSRALHATHTAKVLVIGSSSTVGVGASSPSRTYVARVEADLESALKGTDFQVVGRGMSGEVAQGAADRMKREVEQVKPDLVIWQVGTNDALRHVAIDSFKNCMKKTLAWLKEQQIDVVLINPQYGDALIQDAYYENVVAAIADVARQSQVLLVDRFGAMRQLQRETSSRIYLSADNLHMNDEGYRRLAEQLAATIIRALHGGVDIVVQNRTALRASAIE
jgi:acyl-CoA thioesterase I